MRFAKILSVLRIPTTAWVLALVSSGLQILVFPKASLYFLCWIAMVPLLYALLRGRGGEGALVDPEGRSLRPFTLVQGFLIAWVRMPSFVVTLGGLLIFEGIAFHILAGSTINVFDNFIDSLGTYFLPNWLSWVIVAGVVAVYVISSLWRVAARRRAGLPQVPIVRTVVSAAAIAIGLAVVVATLNSYRGVPAALGLLALFTTIFWFLSTKLPYGRHIYAVGGNQEAARRAGINTTAVRWTVFGISGMMAGIAGVMLTGYSQAGSTTVAGGDLLLDVISIAVIGGVSLTGGKGSVWGVLLGGLVLASINSGLNLMNTDPYYIYVIKGAILLLAIFIDVLGKRWDELPFHRWLQLRRTA